MSLTTPSVLEPVSSGELQAIDLDRVHEVDRRHALVAEYLALRNLDAVLLTRPENIAWLSCGGDCTRRGGDSVASLFVTPDARLVLCSAADSGQLFDRELSGLGFQLKERPWTEPRHVLMQDLCRGRNVAADIGLSETLHRDLADFRMLLSDRDQSAMRLLGMDVTHAVEAAARNCPRGETESEVAGQIAHRLMRREIVPVSIQVMADGQGRRYRHWAFGADRIERFAVMTVVGRRHGVHVGISRTFCFGSPPQQLLDWHQHACLIQATGMYFSHTGWAFRETWNRVARIYEKFGAPDEWRSAEQAEVIGYDAAEASVVPNSEKKFAAGIAVYWHPSVRSAVVGDTILLTPTGFEQLTVGDNWPQLPIQIKGQSLTRPAVLYRETSPTDWSTGG